MKKKIVAIFLSLILVATCVFILSACDFNNKKQNNNDVPSNDAPSTEESVYNDPVPDNPVDFIKAWCKSKHKSYTFIADNNKVSYFGAVDGNTYHFYQGEDSDDPPCYYKEENEKLIIYTQEGEKWTSSTVEGSITDYEDSFGIVEETTYEEYSEMIDFSYFNKNYELKADGWWYYKDEEDIIATGGYSRWRIKDNTFTYNSNDGEIDFSYIWSINYKITLPKV